MAPKVRVPMTFAIVLLSWSAFAAAIPTQAPPTNSVATESLEVRLAEARTILAGMAPDTAALTNAPPGIPAQEGMLRRAMYQRLVRLYEQQISAIGELESLKSRKAELERQAQTWSGFSEPRPYSILLVDSLREEIQAERLKSDNGQAAISVLDQLVEDNRRSLAKAEEKIRLLNDRLENALDSAGRSRLTWERDQQRLQRQVAGASVAGLEVERLLSEERLAQSRIRLGLLQRQLAVAQTGAAFTQADLDKSLSRLEADGQQIERELAVAEAKREGARQALETARRELARLQSSPDAGAPAVARAMESADLRRTELETADTSVAVLRVLLEAGNVGRLMWEQRFAAYRSESADTLQQAKRGLDGFSRRILLWKDYYQQQFDVGTSQVSLQEARLSKLEPGSDLVPLAKERLASLREREQLLSRIMAAILRAQRLIERWDEGLQDTASKLPLMARVQNLFSDANGFLRRLWTFELFTAVDTITVDGQPISGKRAVTVGKVTMAALILIFGYWISGLISALVEPIIIKRLKIEPNQANLIRRWLRVVLVLCLVLFSLVSVKIPLTVFAFAGGALAIGLGFGTQTLLKNFVSGIIILFERPFRVGDVIEVGGQRGAVTSVGLRASIVQLWDGTEALIPNSTLLETSLTNWTYTNRKVRFSVTVGVAYGADPRRVIQILSDVAERHGLVEKEPKPITLLTEFGESTLNFELRFWVDVFKGNSAQVSSDLRLMIVGALAEQGISIDYPQRDVHLDAKRPLQVQVVAAADQAADRRQPPTINSL